MLNLEELKTALEHDAAQRGRTAPDAVLEVRRQVRGAVLLLDEADCDLVAQASGIGTASVAMTLARLDKARQQIADAERRLLEIGRPADAPTVG